MILDHSDTTLRLGFVTDINHEILDSGEKNRSIYEKMVRLPRACLKCAYLKPPGTRDCPVCGFVPEVKSEVEPEEGELQELNSKKQSIAKNWSYEDKVYFYAELLGYAREKDYKEGWAYHTYRIKVGAGPLMKPSPVDPSFATRSWIRHLNIAKAKQREKQNGFSNGSQSGSREMA